jgi:hypothetical protein
MAHCKPITDQELEQALAGGGAVPSDLRIEINDELLRRINIESAKRRITNKALIVKAFLFLIKNEEVRD